jgi:hypothetical protein
VPRVEIAERSREWPLVTVAAFAHDDAEQMRRSLDALLALDYPAVEVAVFGNRCGRACKSRVLPVGMRHPSPHPAEESFETGAGLD